MQHVTLQVAMTITHYYFFIRATPLRVSDNDARTNDALAQQNLIPLPSDPKTQKPKNAEVLRHRVLGLFLGQNFGAFQVKKQPFRNVSKTSVFGTFYSHAGVIKERHQLSKGKESIKC